MNAYFAVAQKQPDPGGEGVHPALTDGLLQAFPQALSLIE